MHDIVVYAVVLLPLLGWLAWAGGSHSAMNFYERDVQRAMRRQSRLERRHHRLSNREPSRRRCRIFRR
ncbi:Uncharacterised protein [Mycobacteroides abscessus subsp. bolletii]|nr:Uncharacterised protein [Mycobacteroides abscessus subsp. bolletii]SKF85225.1 Uncharacterised protein [Mycobacteroides abscessus subsp. bolletii]SKG61682.1 Uncharacterised protein [Mycobacteroides abscessus subsp. bolletii]SKG69509.1 Uncharacterised protein [Mycobacteroides abscessus subsp. bolletii]SKG73853.1 Uncharacterised protein [Mycobacteroides abscessus subsp. bolletii]